MSRAPHFRFGRFGAHYNYSHYRPFSPSGQWVVWSSRGVVKPCTEHVSKNFIHSPVLDTQILEMNRLFRPTRGTCYVKSCENRMQVMKMKNLFIQRLQYMVPNSESTFKTPPPPFKLYLIRFYPILSYCLSSLLLLPLPSYTSPPIPSPTNQVSQSISPSPLFDHI